jgi:D-methionine transport system substrate-binding protein
VNKKLTLILLTAVLSLTGCDRQHNDKNTLRVGTISGPETTLMETAATVAAKRAHLNVVITEFNDYALPNTALNDGSIDANVFQHLPYLQHTIKAKNYRLTAIGKTFVYPMGIYSQKIKSLEQLPRHAIIAIPNDPSNGARALLLLTKAGLIKLQPQISTDATVINILANPKNIQIKEIDAAQLPRVLSDVDAAIINSNYAIPAGLSPSHDAIFLEGPDSQYANLVVIRTADINDPRMKKLMDALHSPEVLQKAKELFHAEAIPAW